MAGQYPLTSNSLRSNIARAPASIDTGLAVVDDKGSAQIDAEILAVVEHVPVTAVDDDRAGVQPWRGLRPVSPDGMPYVGRLKRYRNVSVAAGHAMMGLSLAPITGQLMSEVLSSETPSIDMVLLDPERYA